MPQGGVRLLYLFPEALPLPRARGLQVVRTIHALAEAGIDIELAYAPDSEADPFRSYGLIPPSRLTFARLSRALGWPLQQVRSNSIFMARVARRMRKQPPDAIMVRHLKPAAMLARTFPHIPMLYEAHEVFADTAPAAKRARYAKLEIEVMRAAAAIVTNSRATAARLLERYGKRDNVITIPNGVDWPTTIPVKPWRDAAQHVIYAGSFFGWKGIDDLIAAARSLGGHRVTLIGGEPEQIERLRAQQTSPGAALVFSGRVPHADVMQALGGACIAVLPNRADPDSAFTSPIKLFEYMANGCAVVAADLPALREIIGADDAVWFAPGDVQGLADAIRQLTTNPEHARALGERVREKARGFTWQTRAQRLKSVLEQIALREGARN